MMIKAIEKMISTDLGMKPEDIRVSKWDVLDKKAVKSTGRAFRPENVFLESGNIHLASNRTMGLRAVEFRGFLRGLLHRIRCLVKNRDKE